MGETLKVGIFKGRFITRLEEEKGMATRGGFDNKAPAKEPGSFGLTFQIRLVKI